MSHLPDTVPASASAMLSLSWVPTISWPKKWTEGSWGKWELQVGYDWRLYIQKKAPTLYS